MPPASAIIYFIASCLLVLGNISPTSAAEECTRLGEQIQQLQLTPFGGDIYDLSSSSGTFDTLFNSSIDPADAERVFLDSALVFKQQFGIPDSNESPKYLSEAAKNFFAAQVTPLEYFTSIVNTMEDFLRMKDILTPSNCQTLASFYNKLMQDNLKPFGTVNDSLISRHILNKVHEEFFEKITHISADDAEYVLTRLADEMNRIRNSRDRFPFQMFPNPYFIENPL